jgi:hypothetical protein
MLREMTGEQITEWSAYFSIKKRLEEEAMQNANR